MMDLNKQRADLIKKINYAYQNPEISLEIREKSLEQLRKVLEILVPTKQVKK